MAHMGISPGLLWSIEIWRFCHRDQGGTGGWPTEDWCCWWPNWRVHQEVLPKEALITYLHLYLSSVNRQHPLTNQPPAFTTCLLVHSWSSHSACTFNSNYTFKVFMHMYINPYMGGGWIHDKYILNLWKGCIQHRECFQTCFIVTVFSLHGNNKQEQR